MQPQINADVLEDLEEFVGALWNLWLRFEFCGCAIARAFVDKSVVEQFIRRMTSGRPGRTPPARRRTPTASLTAPTLWNLSLWINFALGLKGHCPLVWYSVKLVVHV